MTVCVATIGDNGQMLILAADRMITSLAQYQSPSPKVFSLTTSIAVMWASDDVSLQTVVHNRLQGEINAKVVAAPATWLEVEQVARLYQQQYIRLRHEMVEHAVLQPFGLTWTTFLATEQSLSETFSEQVRASIGQYQLPGMSALIVGMDKKGAAPDTQSQAHIYKVSDGEISCHDALGYAAIGSGSFHAMSHLQKAGHGPALSGEEALLAAYLAKRRGEASAGVGAKTDFYYFQPRPPYPGFRQEVGGDITELLGKEYDRLLRAEAQAAKKTERALRELLNQRGQPPIPPGQASVPSPVPTQPAPAAGGEPGAAGGD